MTLYPVGLSRDLPEKRVMRAHVDGTDLAVWRSQSGSVQAWNNRCPHRGMALSHGFVRGDTLACLYHGWHFGASGRCRYIPAHPDLEPPETIQTVQHEVRESGGVIWVGPVRDMAPERPEPPAAPPAPTAEPLRSLIMAAETAAIARATLATPFEGAVPEHLAGARYAAGDVTLHMLTNPLGDDTQITLLVTPGLPLPRKRALSRWLEAVRRAAEGAPRP